MPRNFSLATTTFLGLMIIIGCSGSGNVPVMPDTPGTALLTADYQLQDSHNFLLGYYDIYFDPQNGTFEAVENRTSAFTLNITPFLNQMTVPQNGITFDSILIHNDDPAFLGVDVEFSIYHPFPGYDQYEAYDLRGVVIGDGADTLAYETLRVSRHETDLWMKNPDGFSRWFNPTEFTSTLIFGYAPGGWQNYAGNAHINPYKYYSKHLGKDDDLWSYLTGSNNWDGIFESGSGRTMELEFPLPPDGIGIMFGYAVVVCWEDQGETGPFFPVHVPEAVACSASQNPDVWYNEIDGSGGDLILDIDLFAWEEQPSTVKIESSVLDNIEEFDFETYASPGGDHYSTWHVEATAKTLTTPENHYYWVIAEYGGYDYSNGMTGIPHAEGSLAAFFKYEVEVLPESPIPPNNPPVCDLVIVGGETEFEDWAPVSVEFDASGSYDPDVGDSIALYEWDFGDGWVPGSETEIYNFDEDYIGDVMVRVTDTYGAVSEPCSVSIDVTAHPSKNLPLRDGVKAWDISIDPANGDLYITYGDYSMYMYTRDSYYQDETPFLVYESWGIGWPFWLDINNEGYISVTTNANDWPNGGNTHYRIYHTDGSGPYMSWQNGGDYTPIDSAAITSGYFENYITTIVPVDYTASDPPYWSTLLWGSHNIGGTWSMNWRGNYQCFTPWDGLEKLYPPYIVAHECDLNGTASYSYMWFVENEDWYCTRWELRSSWPWMFYDNAFFGTGTQTDDDDCWNDAKDLTRDNENRFFVLDKLSDETARIKVWEVDDLGPNTTSLGGFGDSTTINGDPTRIEGSDYEGLILVLHESDPADLLSVFLPSEMPE